MFTAHSPEAKNLPPQPLPSLLTRSGGFVPRTGMSHVPQTDHRSRVVAFSRYRAPVFRNCPYPILIHDPVDWVRFLVRPSSIVLTLMRMV